MQGRHAKEACKGGKACKDDTHARETSVVEVLQGVVGVGCYVLVLQGCRRSRVYRVL
jgi:hypothetical protein